MSELVWGSFDVGGGPAHPSAAKDPSGEPWTCAELNDERNEAFACVWVGEDGDTVVADFTFVDALRGTSDAASLPLLVDGFFGHDGHTFGYYRKKYRSVRFTNLRTKTSWATTWDELDDVVAEMKTSNDYVRRRMR